MQTREEFTKDTIQTLTEGADKLTLADQNEEGAKMLALQTRLQLGVTSLSLASPVAAERAVAVLDFPVQERNRRRAGDAQCIAGLGRFR